MRNIGSTMVVLGILAIVLNFVNMVPSILYWIYSWGDTTAWIIKIATIVVGAILYFMGGKGEVEEEA